MERYRAGEAFCQYSMFLFSHKGVNCHIPCDLSLTGFQNAGHGTFCHVYHAFSAGALPAAGSIRVKACLTLRLQQGSAFFCLNTFAFTDKSYFMCFQFSFPQFCYRVSITEKTAAVNCRG